MPATTDADALLRLREQAFGEALDAEVRSRMVGTDFGRRCGLGSAPTRCLARRSGDVEMSAYRKFIDTLQSEQGVAQAT